MRKVAQPHIPNEVTACHSSYAIRSWQHREYAILRRNPKHQARREAFEPIALERVLRRGPVFATKCACGDVESWKVDTGHVNKIVEESADDTDPLRRWIAKEVLGNLWVLDEDEEREGGICTE
jgi:hypothetical protein